MTSQEILQKFDEERREFIRGIFRQASKAKIWCHINLQQAATATGSPRDRVIRALDYLAEQGYLELQAEGVRHRYRRLKVPADLGALATDLHQRAENHEHRELRRLDQVLQLVAHDGCQFAALCEHFGEIRNQPCGHCSWCLNRTPCQLPPRQEPPVDQRVAGEAEDHLVSHLKKPIPPQLVARFLCGVNSPQLTRAKVSSHRLFGSLAHIPYRQVLAMCQK